jgi:Na+/citrate or Na+/malate symporter
MKNENLVPQRVKNKVDMYDKFLSKSTTDTVALALGNVKVPKTQITQVESNEKTETKNETDEITKMQFEMNKFDIRTTLERRKKRTIW